MTEPMQPIHATAVARHTPDGWCGALIQGPSGVGKSDLALRLIGQGWRLVADDWTHLWASGGALYGMAPATIAGRIEVRGLGIVGLPVQPLARIVLAIQCTHETIERLPEAAAWSWNGVAIPQLRLDPRPASAGQVVATALAAL
ncbi:serine kinase [Brevundimonas sp.]|uniref:HPr kinase/phosphorylase n=1 Tax=Brevundimonas sp. TaxID=1871086 RepID=UPI00289B29BA|nr:serine kinase [Brevundimonas sp.]